jgi:hypothetical protein
MPSALNASMNALVRNFKDQERNTALRHMAGISLPQSVILVPSFVKKTCRALPPPGPGSSEKTPRRLFSTPVIDWLATCDLFVLRAANKFAYVLVVEALLIILSYPDVTSGLSTQCLPRQ